MYPTIAVRQATTADIPDIAALLKAEDLPAEDFSAHLALFRVATGDQQQIVGTVGLEPCGEHALLRSLVVAPEARGTGLGMWLVQLAIKLARTKGYKELWLLTTTASQFFANMDFVETDRASAPPQIAATKEFSHLCPGSATCMTLQL